MFQILRFTDLESDASFIYDYNFDSDLYFDSEYYLNLGAYSGYVSFGLASNLCFIF